jgi:hypothetical protein
MNCPECGTPEPSCKERFDEFLVLEFTYAGFGSVHHLTVSAFMIQHSSRLTLEGWFHMRELLREFLVEHKSPAFILSQYRHLVDSGKRKFRITSKDGMPVIKKTMWAKTIVDVRMETADIYCADVIEWARTVMEEAATIATVPS